MSPLELMQRLAALVPPPRRHLIRFHGVLAPHAKLRAAIVAPPAQQATEHPADHAHAPGSPKRMSWACLLKRVFDLDIEHCQNCGGRLQIIAALVDPAVIAKILAHLRWPARAPPRSPARRVDLFQAA
jgi:Putative transposase